MYLRFRTSFVNDCRETQYGVFQAAWFLLNNDIMYSHDRQQLEEVWMWFVHNLRKPPVYQQRKPNAHVICWFKPDADEHLRKMYEMIQILESYDIYVSRIKCRKPGYIVYEDLDQVAAIPFTRLLPQVR